MFGGVFGLEKLLGISIIEVPAYSIVLVNGRYVPEISDVDGADGMEVFAGENGVGVDVRIANGVRYEKPVHIINYVDCADDFDDTDVNANDEKNVPVEKISLNNKCNFVIGDGADVVLLESMVSDMGGMFEYCNYCHINIGCGANVRRYAVYDVSDKSKTKFLGDATVADGAKFLDVSVGLGVGEVLVQKDANIGVGADVGVYSSVYAKKATNANFSISLYHNGDDGKSRVGLWAVDDGRVEFQTEARVAKNVRGVETAQESRILLNSDGAIGRIKPFQFIATEGAKAYHGAVVSGVKEEELFFLGSRGIGEVDARRLIAESVMANVLNFIGDEFVRDKMKVGLKK